MKMLDARRLTGINVLWKRPCAIVDVALSENDGADWLITHWKAQVASVLPALALESSSMTHRFYRGGLSLAVSAPVDALYAMVEVAEWAYNSCEACAPNATPAPASKQQIETFRQLQSDEAAPELLRLGQLADANAVAFLWDDDDASVGLGAGSRSFSRAEVPQEPKAAIDWQQVHDVPVGLVTGTNGKTTTVRLASRILRKSGKRVGLSSTDWIGVDDDIIDRGDYSGPGGARTVLRQPTVDAAILETARGGLLRRGLGVERADAALITNIAEDHLGDFGSGNLDELLSIKWLVTAALDQRSHAVLNADDPLLVERAETLESPIIWFAMSPDNATVKQHTESGGKAVSVIDGHLAQYAEGTWSSVCPVNDVPVTLNGSARHNVANALAAIGLTWAMGAPVAAMREGLISMGINDNPGRCNIFHVDGKEVLLDFAHNPHAIKGIFDLARARPAKRRVLCFGQAGDRTDTEIRELAASAWGIGLDHVIISELGDYRRGREPGEVYELLKDELLKNGAAESQIEHFEVEAQSLAAALDWAEPGDLVIMLALADAANLIKHLESISDDS